MPVFSFEKDGSDLSPELKGQGSTPEARPGFSAHMLDLDDALIRNV